MAARRQCDGDAVAMHGVGAQVDDDVGVGDDAGLRLLPSVPGQVEKW